MVVLAMLFLIATFGLNFPIFIATMAVSVFHAEAHEYGLLSSLMAVGSVVGAMLSARQQQPRRSLLLAGAAAFGIGCTAAAPRPAAAVWRVGHRPCRPDRSRRPEMTVPPSSADKASDVDPPAHPSDEELLDMALLYTFPASDPIAVDCCRVRSLGAPEADPRG